VAVRAAELGDGEDGVKLPTKGELAAGAVADWCRREGLPAPETEHYFARPRRWRFDCAWLTPRKVALELHGKTWAGGRHTRGKGFAADREKMNEAQIRGWVVIEATYDQFDSGQVWLWLRAALGEMGDG
jgi:hypothetical protein